MRLLVSCENARYPRHILESCVSAVALRQHLPPDAVAVTQLVRSVFHPRFANQFNISCSVQVCDNCSIIASKTCACAFCNRPFGLLFQTLLCSDAMHDAFINLPISHSFVVMIGDLHCTQYYINSHGCRVVSMLSNHPCEKLSVDVKMVLPWVCRRWTQPIADHVVRTINLPSSSISDSRRCLPASIRNNQFAYRF